MLNNFRERRQNEANEKRSVEKAERLHGMGRAAMLHLSAQILALHLLIGKVSFARINST